MKHYIYFYTESFIWRMEKEALYFSPKGKEDYIQLEGLSKDLSFDDIEAVLSNSTDDVLFTATSELANYIGANKEKYESFIDRIKSDVSE